MWSIFSCTYWPGYVFLGEMSIQVLCPFLNWVVFLLLSCKSSLCILDTSPLSDKWFVVNIFSHSVDCLFTFLIVSYGTPFLSRKVLEFVKSFLCVCRGTHWDIICLQQQRHLGNVGLLTLCSLRLGWLLRKLECHPKIYILPPGRGLMNV